MNATQSTAYAAFLATLSPSQRVALMDVLSSHVSNVDDSVALGDDAPPHHDLVVALDTATTFAVAAEI